MSAKWADGTSYSRSDKDRVPRAWDFQGGVRLCVHRHIDYPPETWLVTCYPLDIDRVELKSLDVEDAKTEALTLCRNTALRIVSKLGVPE